MGYSSVNCHSYCSIIITNIIIVAEEAGKGAATIPKGSIKVRDEKKKWLNSLTSRMRRASPSKRGKITDVKW